MRLIDGKFRITRDHGLWYDVDGMRAMAIYHPAALLRDPGRRPGDLRRSEEPPAGGRRVCQHTELRCPWGGVRAKLSAKQAPETPAPVSYFCFSQPAPAAG